MEERREKATQGARGTETLILILFANDYRCQIKKPQLILAKYLMTEIELPGCIPGCLGCQQGAEVPGAVCAQSISPGVHMRERCSQLSPNKALIAFLLLFLHLNTIYILIVHCYFYNHEGIMLCFTKCKTGIVNTFHGSFELSLSVNRLDTRVVNFRESLG